MKTLWIILGLILTLYIPSLIGEHPYFVMSWTSATFLYLGYTPRRLL